MGSSAPKVESDSYTPQVERVVMIANNARQMNAVSPTTAEISGPQTCEAGATRQPAGSASRALSNGHSTTAESMDTDPGYSGAMVTTCPAPPPLPTISTIIDEQARQSPETWIISLQRGEPESTSHTPREVRETRHIILRATNARQTDTPLPTIANMSRYEAGVTRQPAESSSPALPNEDGATTESMDTDPGYPGVMVMTRPAPPPLPARSTFINQQARLRRESWIEALERNELERSAYTPREVRETRHTIPSANNAPQTDTALPTTALMSSPQIRQTYETRQHAESASRAPSDGHTTTADSMDTDPGGFGVMVTTQTVPSPLPAISTFINEQARRWLERRFEGSQRAEPKSTSYIPRGVWESRHKTQSAPIMRQTDAALPTIADTWSPQTDQPVKHTFSRGHSTAIEPMGTDTGNLRHRVASPNLDLAYMDVNLQRLDDIINKSAWLKRNVLEPCIGDPDCPVEAVPHGIHGQSLYTAFVEIRDGDAYGCKYPQCGAYSVRCMEEAVRHQRLHHFNHSPYLCTRNAWYILVFHIPVRWLGTNHCPSYSDRRFPSQIDLHRHEENCPI